MKKWPLFAAAWIACAPLTFGMVNGMERREYSELSTVGSFDGYISYERAELNARRDCGFSAFIALGGPIGLTVAVFFTGFASEGLSYNCEAIPHA